MILRRSSLLLSAWLAGCGFAAGFQADRLENHCDDSNPCAEGRCDPHFSVCVSDVAQPYTYGLSVIVPGDGAKGRPPLTQRFGPFVAAHGVTHDLAVAPTVAVAGAIRSRGTPVEADVSFTPRLVGRGPDVAAVTARTLDAAAAIESDRDYMIELLAGVTYDVEIRPRGKDAARFWPLRREVMVNGNARRDLEYPRTEPLRGAVVDSFRFGQSDLEVRAIDGAGRLVSSVAVTGTTGSSDPGRFEIYIEDPNASDWVFQISAPPSYRTRQAFPTISIDPSVLVPDANGLIQLLVPSPSEGTCFTGVIQSTEGSAAIGATVLMRSTTLDARTGLVGTYRVQTVSTLGGFDPTGCSGSELPPGGFEVVVLPGEYAIEVHPVETTLGVLAMKTTITAASPVLGSVWQVPSREQLGGIVTAGGMGVGDIRVQAIPRNVMLSALPIDVASGLNRPSEGVTDAVGYFLLGVDRGLYDLLVEPPVGSGYAWLVRSNVQVAENAEPVTFELGAPLVASGVVRFASAESAANAEVTAFIELGDGVDTRVITIGRTQTDERGEFVLPLPASVD